MKPPAFDYHCAETIEDAVALLSRHAGEAKVIAGGQSLLPMLNFRVVKPALLIDIGKLVELDYVREGDSQLNVGALTRHRTLETSDLVATHLPIIPEAMRHVAHLAIRNRGTIGGSLSHADPAAELPMLARLLDATIIARSVRGRRAIEAHEFFVGALTTSLHDDEVVEEVQLPVPSQSSGWAFEEFAKRPGDFALAAVGAVLEADGGRISRARVAMMGVGETPIRCQHAEALLVGTALTEDVLEATVKAACEPLEPPQDLHASADYRRHLASVLSRRVLRRAWQRTQEYS